MDLPSWEEFAEGTQPAGKKVRSPLSQGTGGRSAHTSVLNTISSVRSCGFLCQTLTEPGRGQSVSLPTSRFSKFDGAVFRVLFPLSPPRSCRSGWLLDPLGHHRAGCSEAGVLGQRGFPLEKGAEQVCREAGARVSTNVFVRDMDLTTFGQSKDRGCADGHTLWNGSQLPKATTFMSPLHWDGRARRKAATHNGAALQNASAGGRPPRVRSSLEKEDEHGWQRKWEDASRKKQ